MQEISKNKTIILINALGSLIKKHRKEQGKTIYSISAEVSMSKSTWREAEIVACKDIKFQNFRLYLAKIQYYIYSNFFLSIIL